MSIHSPFICKCYTKKLVMDDKDQLCEFLQLPDLCWCMGTLCFSHGLWRDILVDKLTPIVDRFSDDFFVARWGVCCNIKQD